MARRRLASRKSPFNTIAVGSVTLSYGAETSNARAVTIQALDDSGAAVVGRVHLRFYLSQAAGGAAIVTNAPAGGIAIGAKGAILVAAVANKVLDIITDATGAAILTVTDASGAITFFPNVVTPSGVVFNGESLVFAA